MIPPVNLPSEDIVHFRSEDKPESVIKTEQLAQEHIAPTVPPEAKPFKANLSIPQEVKSGSGIGIFLEKMASLGWWNLARFVFPPVLLIDFAYLIYCSVMPASHFIPEKNELRASLSSHLSSQKDWLHVIQLSKELFHEGKKLEEALKIGHALQKPSEAIDLLNGMLQTGEPILIPCGFFDGDEFIPTLISLRKSEDKLIVQEFLLDHRYSTDGKINPVRAWEIEKKQLNDLVYSLSQLIKPQKEAVQYTLQQKQLQQKRAVQKTAKEEPIFVQIGVGEILKGFGTPLEQKGPLKSKSTDPFKLIHTWIETQKDASGCTVQDKLIFMAQAHQRMAALVLKYSKRFSLQELALLQINLVKRLDDLKKLAEKHDNEEVKTYIKGIEGKIVSVDASLTQLQMRRSHESRRIEALSGRTPTGYPKIKADFGLKPTENPAASTTKVTLNSNLLHQLNALEFRNLDQLSTLLQAGEELLNAKSYREAALLSNGILSAIPHPEDPFWQQCQLDQTELNRLSACITQASKQLFEARMHLNPTHLWNEEILNLANARCAVVKILQVKADKILKEKLSGEDVSEFQTEIDVGNCVKNWIGAGKITKDEAYILIGSKYKDSTIELSKWMSDPYFTLDDPKSIEKFLAIRRFIQATDIAQSLDNFDQTLSHNMPGGNDPAACYSLVTNLGSIGGQDQKLVTLQAISHNQPGMLAPQLIELRQMQVFSTCLIHPEYSLYLGFSSKIDALSWFGSVAQEASRSSDDPEKVKEKIVELQRRDLDLQLQKMGRLHLIVGDSIISDSENPSIFIIKVVGENGSFLEYHPSGLPIPMSEGKINIDNDVNAANCGYLPKGIAKAAIGRDQNNPWKTYSDSSAFIHALKEKVPSLQDQERVNLYQLQVVSDKDANLQPVSDKDDYVSLINAFNTILANPEILTKEMARMRLNQILQRPGILQEFFKENPSYHQEISKRLTELSSRSKNLEVKAFLSHLMQEPIDLTPFADEIVKQTASRYIALFYLQTELNADPQEINLKILFLAWQQLSSLPPRNADEFAVWQKMQLHLIPTLFNQRSDEEIQELCNTFVGTTGLRYSNDGYIYTSQNFKIDFFSGNFSSRKTISTELPDGVRCDPIFLKIFGGHRPSSVQAIPEGLSKVRYNFKIGERTYSILFNPREQSSIYSLQLGGKEWIHTPVETDEASHMALTLKESGLWYNENEALLLLGNAGDWKTEGAFAERKLLVSLNKNQQIKSIKTEDGQLVLHDQSKTTLRSLGVAHETRLLLLKDPASNRLGFRVIGTPLSFIKDKDGNFAYTKDDKWKIKLRETSGIIKLFGENYQQFMIPLTNGDSHQIEYHIFPYMVRSKALGRKGYPVDYVQPPLGQQTMPTLKLSGVTGQEIGSHATFFYLAYQACCRGDLEQANYWLEKAQSATYIESEKEFLTQEMGHLLETIPANTDSQAAFLLKARLSLSRIGRQHYHQLTINPETVMSRQQEIEGLISLSNSPNVNRYLRQEDKHELELLKKECIASIFGIEKKETSIESTRKLPNPLPDSFYNHLIFWMEPPRKKISLDFLRQEGIRPSPDSLLKHFWDYWALIEKNELTPEVLSTLFAQQILVKGNPELYQAVDCARKLLLAKAQQGTQISTEKTVESIMVDSSRLLKQPSNYEAWLGKLGTMIDLRSAEDDKNLFNSIKDNLKEYVFKEISSSTLASQPSKENEVLKEHFLEQIDQAEKKGFIKPEEAELYRQAKFPTNGSARSFLEKLLETGPTVVQSRYSVVLDAKVKELEEKFNGASSSVEFRSSKPEVETAFKDYKDYFKSKVSSASKLPTFNANDGTPQENSYLNSLDQAVKIYRQVNGASITDKEGLKKDVKEEIKEKIESSSKLRQSILKEVPNNEEYLRIQSLIEETTRKIKSGDRTVGLLGLLRELKAQKKQAETALITQLFEEYRDGTLSAQLQTHISKLLLIETRIQQLVKVQNLLLKNTVGVEGTIQYLLENSKYGRYDLNSYGFEQAKVREFLVFEWKNGIILRPEQIEKIETLINTPNALEIFRMGLGKTFAVFPLVARLQTLQNKFPILYFPEGLLEQSHEKLDQRAYIFSFSRYSPCEPTQLKELYATLLEVATSNRYVSTTIESRCYLKNKIVELNEQLLNEPDSKEIHERIRWLTKIDLLLEPQKKPPGKQTVSLVDEPDEVFNITHQRNYAIDYYPSPIDNRIYDTGVKIFEFLRNHSMYGTEAVSKLSEDEAKALMIQLATDKNLLTEFAKTIYTDKRFVDYITNQSAAPPWLGPFDRKNPKFIEALLYRHWITKTLPTLFKETYGLENRIEEGGHLVAPLDRGAKLINTTYGEEFELAGHQFFAYLYHQPSREALLSLKPQLLALGVQEELFERTDALSAQEWKDLQPKYLQVLFRTSSIVQINREQIICNVQDGLNQTQAAAASGTMNPQALPATFKKPTAVETLAVSAETLIKMSLGDPEFFDKEIGSFSSLEEKMAQLCQDPDCKAIINQGQSIGDKTTLDLIVKLRAGSDRQFIFIHPVYKKPYLWLPGEAAPQPFDRDLDEKKIDKKKVLYYFGPADTRGTDFKIPEGYGALFTGPHTTMPDFEQAVWRLRQLGEGQSIRLFAEMKGNNKDLIVQIAKNTVEKDLEMNVKAVFDQPRAIVRKTLRQLFYIEPPSTQATIFTTIKEQFPSYFIQKSDILQILEQELFNSGNIDTLKKLNSTYEMEIGALQSLLANVEEVIASDKADLIKEAIVELENKKQSIGEYAPYLPEKMPNFSAANSAGSRQETQQQQQQQQQQAQQQQMQSISLALESQDGHAVFADPIRFVDLFRVAIARQYPKPCLEIGCSTNFRNLLQIARARGEPKTAYLVISRYQEKYWPTLITGFDLAHIYNWIQNAPQSSVYQICSEEPLHITGANFSKSPDIDRILAQSKLILGYTHMTEAEKTALKKWYLELQTPSKNELIQYLKEQLVPEELINLLLTAHLHSI